MSEAGKYLFIAEIWGGGVRSIYYCLLWLDALLLVLFSTTRSVFKSVKVSVVEIAKRTN